MALLRELYQRNPKRPGLDRELGLTTDRLIDGYVKDEGLRRGASVAPEPGWGLSRTTPSCSGGASGCRGQAAPLLAEARAAADSGQWDKAAEMSRRMTVLWPELSGARELAQNIHQKVPRVVVGVGSFAAEMAPGRLNDWAARRTSRLLYRTLTEFAGASAEGGKYLCPVGEISSTALNRRLLVQLRPGIRWATGDAILSSSDVSRRLLAMVDPNDPLIESIGRT